MSESAVAASTTVKAVDMGHANLLSTLSPHDLAVGLLGGEMVVDGVEDDAPLAVHRRLLEGLPPPALVNLSLNLPRISLRQMAPALGVSVRTLERARSAQTALDVKLSDSVWTLARLTADAASVLGSVDAAQDWLMTPALALEQQRPIDLLSTTAGVGLVEDLLGRMRYGVYA
jgi:putative toxin-antitoxin system antitoxin component (TIGR02293 family)